MREPGLLRFVGFFVTERNTSWNSREGVEIGKCRLERVPGIGSRNAVIRFKRVRTALICLNYVCLVRLIVITFCNVGTAVIA